MSCTVAKPWRIDVSEKTDRHADFQCLNRRWRIWKIARIQESRLVIENFTLVHRSIDGLIRRRFFWYSVLNAEIYGVEIVVGSC